MRLTTLMLAFGILLSPMFLQETNAKSKKKFNLSSLKADSTNTAYKKISGAKIADGLFKVIYKPKDGKLYFELPDSAFSRQYILANRMASTSDTQDFVAGQMITTPMLIEFTKDERNVYINLIQSNSTVSKEDPIASAFDKNFVNPRLKGLR